MNQTAIFDLKDLFMNELIGDVWLFVIVGLILIWLGAARAKLPMGISVVMSIWWLVVCFAMDTGLVILWFFALLASALLFYYAMVKVMIK